MSKNECKNKKQNKTKKLLSKWISDKQESPTKKLLKSWISAGTKKPQTKDATSSK